MAKKHRHHHQAKNCLTKSIILPPPNITGGLHLGHAFQQVIMDILAKSYLQRGYQLSWLFGFDHAGIAGQLKIEQAAAKEGIQLTQETRQLFAANFTTRIKNKMIEQMKLLNLSVNFKEQKFTLSKTSSLIVHNALTKLCKNNIVYQEDKVVYYDGTLQTVICRSEVDFKAVNSKMYFLAYKCCGEELIVATTQPETLFADVALAINPNDKKLSKFIGQKATVPITNKIVPIIAEESVEPTFGSGALKITPGHSFVDFELGKKHNLPIISILDKRNKLINCTQNLNGLSVLEAREQIVAELEQQSLLVRVINHQSMLPYNSKSNSLLQPVVTKQLFIAVDKLVPEARKCIETEQIKFFPKFYKMHALAILDNMHDWCISRQLWWGHPIDLPDDSGIDNFNFKDSVLDTWFSSALWPKIVASKKMPHSVVVTGWDIMLFWVLRMIMLNIYLYHTIPFREVMITGLISDFNNKKMSKSTGNTLAIEDLLFGITEEELADRYAKSSLSVSQKEQALVKLKNLYCGGIKPVNSDVLRFQFSLISTEKKSAQFSWTVLKGARNLYHKIKNIVNFIGQINPRGNLGHQFNLNQWMAAKLHALEKTVNDYLDVYKFHCAASAIANFVYNDFCSFYIEALKWSANSDEHGVNLNTAALAKILYPFMPTLADEICKQVNLPQHAVNLTIEHPSDDLELIYRIVQASRKIKLNSLLIAATTEAAAAINKYQQYILCLTKKEKLTVTPKITDVPVVQVRSANLSCEIKVE